MSKQTDLINIPDAITVSGSNVGINEQSPDRQLHITDTSEVNVKLEAGADTSEIRLKDSDNALTVHLNNNERMSLKSDEVNWTNSTNGFYNKIYGPTSGDIASGYLTYNGSTLRGGFYTNPSHGLTVISDVDMTFRANNANRMHINTSGIVTTPYQPMFSADGGGEQTGDVREVIQFTSATSNVGNHFSTSTYTFTAPVSGHYHFSFSIMTYASDLSRCQFAKNGSLIADQFYTKSASYAEYPRNSGSIIVQLSTNDTLRVDRNVNGASDERCHQNYRSFTGYLLG